MELGKHKVPILTTKFVNGFFGNKENVLEEKEIEIVEIYPKQTCKYCNKQHEIYKCNRINEFYIGYNDKLKFEVSTECYYCQETKNIYMNSKEIENNRKAYNKALNEKIAEIEKQGNLYVVFRHYSLTNNTMYSNSIEIGATDDYDEAIKIIQKDKDNFKKYANKELNEIPDKYKGFYTGGKAPKRLTYSISLGCSFIIKSDGDKKNG